MLFKFYLPICKKNNVCDQEAFIAGMHGWFNIRKLMNVMHHHNHLKKRKKNMNLSIDAII